MYLDEVFNNFLGTLQHVPDIRINNPGLEQGKYVNDRSRHYAAKSIIVGGGGGDGDGGNGCKTLTLQKPDLELIERSSGPEYGTVNEGFRAGSTVEGYWGGVGSSGGVHDVVTAAKVKAYDELSKAYNIKSSEYDAALRFYTDFKQNYDTQSYVNKYVKFIKTKGDPSATPQVSEVADVYYINKYGYRYKLVPTASTYPAPAPPISAYNPVTDKTFIEKSMLDKFPVQPPPPSTKYNVAAGQRLDLAGTIVKYNSATSGPAKYVYVWIDIEGVSHKIDETLLSDTVNNVHSSCRAKLPTPPTEFATEAAFTTAINSALVGTPITASDSVCIEMPSNIITLKKELNEIEAKLAAAAGDLKFEQTANAHAANGVLSREIDAHGEVIQTSSSYINKRSAEYNDITKNMVTYDGKVDDTRYNVKSKLGYYVLWVSLMLFIVVVTFRNIANSDSTESGSFMISAALLILLMIYLFNYLSELRLGPQQMLAKATGDLPEKVSGMMKFTFT
jgi:hypothetical protein